MRSNTLSPWGRPTTPRVPYLGPDRAGNLLGVVSTARDDGIEVVFHAMRMRPRYEPLLRGEGEPDA
jgi:hypothetical protein